MDGFGNPGGIENAAIPINHVEADDGYREEAAPPILQSRFFILD
jgi:hypothetical protein